LNQSASAVDALVAAGARVDIKDALGCTPLYIAVVNYKGSKGCVQALLRAGAKPGVSNDAGLSPRGIMGFGSNRTFRRFFEV
jgi:ankyrin repeat protein